MDKDFLLIRKMKTGDTDAIDVFVRKYYPIILKYIRYHISNTEQSEDLTQETFEKFFRVLAGYQHMGKALNYLYVIARNLCNDFNKKTAEIAMSDIPKLEENQLNRIDDRLDMEQVLKKLPNELQEVIILHYFQELTLKEVATICKIGLPLVKYRIKRAKEELSKLLRKEE